MVLVAAVALLGGWWRIDPVSAAWLWWFTLIIGSVATTRIMTRAQSVHVLTGGAFGVMFIGWLIRTEAMYFAMPAAYYEGHAGRRRFIAHFGSTIGWYIACGWLGLAIGAIASKALDRLARRLGKRENKP